MTFQGLLAISGLDFSDAIESWQANRSTRPHSREGGKGEKVEKVEMTPSCLIFISFPRVSTHMVKQRELVLAASTVVALSAGLNYLFSCVDPIHAAPSLNAFADLIFSDRAYAPQLGSRLRLNSTQLNLVGAAGNLGVYLSCESGKKKWSCSARSSRDSQLARFFFFSSDHWEDRRS